jgi:hypothetical protein
VNVDLVLFLSFATFYQILAETKALTNTTNGYQAIRDALAGCNPPCFPYLYVPPITNAVVLAHCGGR